jgi:DNA-binding Lrp family transcriptional regulator
MGWKDTQWAYEIHRPLAETAVLAALCFRTDDKTHQTFVGQKTIAGMLSSSPEKVLRSLKALERAGVISRSRRHGRNGYRTSDLITVNVETYEPTPLPDETPTRTIAYQENRRSLGDFSSEPTWQKVTAEEVIQEDHSEDHSEAAETRFAEFWDIWPRKVDKPKARSEWARALSRTSANVVLRAAVAFRDNPGIPELKFIPYPANWLAREGWQEDLPQPLKRTPEEVPRKRFQFNEAPSFVTVQPGSDCGEDRHRWQRDGTCLNCDRRQLAASEEASC